MKNFKFLFIVNGNNKIGLGHVYRSINLANSLLKKKHKVSFITQDGIAKKIISTKHECKFIQKINNVKTKQFLNFYEPDLIIIDKLQENKTNLKILRKSCKILAIDYTGKNYELFDYGINFLYPSSKIKNSFSGFEYAILNKEFSKNKKSKIKKRVTSILILQGGADTYCFIPKIVLALNKLKESFRITTVVGSSFQCWPQLKKALSNNKKPLKILRNVNNMPEIMYNHDIAVTAAGNTLLELASIGIPSVIVCGERFENETAKIIEKNQFGINLGFGNDVSMKKIANTVQKLISNYNLRVKMNNRGKTLVDGKGTERVVRLFENLCRQK